MDLKAKGIEWLNGAKMLYNADLDALSDAQATEQPGGHGRRAVDYTYELSVVNRRFLARMKGEDPGAWPAEEGQWVKAPAGQDSREAVRAEFNSSMDELIAEIEGRGDMLEEFDTPNGKSSPLEVCNFTYMHTMYHCGQLNMLQSLNGDMEMHWPMG